MGEKSSNLSGIGSIVQAGWNVLDSLFGWSAKRQKNDTKELMSLQQQYNLENMSLEQQYAKEMFDYQGPAHQMELARAAGLNPLVVAQGNMNLGTASSASSGNIDAGSAGSAAAAFESNRLAQMLQIAQIANINSQTKLNERKSDESEANTNYIISNQKINEEQHSLNMKIGNFEVDVLLPSQVAQNDANTKSILENLKLVEPTIQKTLSDVALNNASIEKMSTDQKIALARNWREMDKHSLEKAMIRAGISKTYSDILVNDANVEMLHQQADLLRTQGKIADWEWKMDIKYGDERIFQNIKSIRLSNDKLVIDNAFNKATAKDRKTQIQSESFKNIMIGIGAFVGCAASAYKNFGFGKSSQQSPVYLDSWPANNSAGVGYANPLPGGDFWSRPALQPSHFGQ